MAEMEKVIKGLECCEEHYIGKSCVNCPYNDYGTDNPSQYDCIDRMARDALELLKKQQKEIEERTNEASAYAELLIKYGYEFKGNEVTNNA